MNWAGDLSSIPRTLQPVARNCKHFPTRRRARLATVSSVTETPWQDLRSVHERIRWARLNRTHFERPTDAAISLGIKPVTYRTWEIPKDQGGREPPISEIQRLAAKYRVSWVWLVSGEGSPYYDAAMEAHYNAFIRKAAEVEPEKRDDAMNAASAVLDAFIRKAG